MASRKVPISRRLTVNLESYACFWLDKDVDTTDENRKTKTQLRSVINHLETFDDDAECEQLIQEIFQEKIVLIVSGAMGRTLIPRIHELKQLLFCFIYCHEKEPNEKWAKKYEKIQGVFNVTGDLLDAITKCHKHLIALDKKNVITIITKDNKSAQSRDAIFMWFQLFIEGLLRMHHKSSDRDELLSLCKKNYAGNPSEMQLIQEFETTYKSEKAIWWYTRESCFYKMLNKALRIQDYNTLLMFRFFITDLAKQIRNEHEKFIRNSVKGELIRVYRGQSIGLDELDQICKNIGGYLSMNSFLSTSSDRNVALNFINENDADKSLRQILFEIDIDPRQNIKPFANVTGLSYFKEEDEVLILLGALFLINKIVEDKKRKIFVASLTLATEDDFQLKQTFSHMKEKIGDETDFVSLGNILYEMGEYEKSKQCYERVLRENALSSSEAQTRLGWALIKMTDYKPSRRFLNEALNTRRELLGDTHSKLADTYRSLGALSWFENKHQESLSYMRKAIAILERTDSNDSLLLSKTYLGIGLAHGGQNESQKELEYYKKALAIQEKILPSDHPDIALLHNNIGCAHRDLGNREHAIASYKKSLKISLRTLPPTHPDVLRTQANIQALEQTE